MTNLKKLVEALQRATGVSRFTTDGVVDALSDAGILPPNERSEVLHIDVAAALGALMGAAAPSDAADYVQSLRRCELASAAIKDCVGVWYTLDADEGRAALLQFGLPKLLTPLDCFEFLLDPQPGGLFLIPHSIDVGCGSDAAFVEIVIDVALRIDGDLIIGGFKLGYRDPNGKQKAFQNIRRLDSSVFLDLVERLNVDHSNNQTGDVSHPAQRVN